jgi:chemotaxis protein CheD
MKPKKYKLPGFSSLPVIYLHPGDCHFSKSPEVISTVLGSCISVVMRSPERGITVVTHSQMPEYNLLESEYLSFRYHYTDSSIYSVIKYFDGQLIPRDTLEVKLFGGAEILAGKSEFNQSSSVGKKNMDTALRVIDKEGLIISASDLGGKQGRKLFIVSDSGEVYLSRLKSGLLLPENSIDDQRE